MSVRITGLQEVSTLQSGDYIAVDNESNGTHKFDAMKMGANMASNIAPAYSTAATYAIGDFCMHDNILYKCTTAISTPESWTASHWTQTSAGVALAQKVDKVSGKGLSQNDFTNALKTKLDGIASGAEVNVQADWSQTNTSADDYIKNKPVDATSSVGGLMSASDKAKLDGIAAGAEVNVQANWTETNTSSDAYIKNKPTNATSSTAGLMSAADKAKLDGIASGAEVNVQADWSQTNTSADDYIKNKPVDATSSVGGLMSATDKAKLDSIEQGAEVNVQADWNQTNTSADDYIKNKPTNATTSTAGLMSASDKTKLDGIETGAQVNVIDGVKVDGTLLTVDGNKDVDIVGKANQISLAPQYSSDTGNYVRGNYVIYQNNLYKCLQDTSGVWDATKWEQVDIGDDLEQKANIDGLYEEMTVGGAEQLISSTFNIESVPYNFRTSGGSLDIGDRETDKLIGGTVVWNQTIQNGDFASVSSWSVFQASYTVANNIATIATNGASGGSIFKVGLYATSGHKYLLMATMKSDGVNTVYLRADSGLTFAQKETVSNDWVTLSGIATVTTTTDNARMLLTSYTNNVTFYAKNAMLIDLTAMFGTTIADYIYNLEQNTAGAGVAFFKKLFPAPYYAYNAGQLMSVNAGSHVMNGFNQWDEEWENGVIYANGSEGADTNSIRSKNYNSCAPNTVYHGKAPSSCLVVWYDANKNFISRNDVTNANATSPDNARYFRISCQAYGTTYNNDICINIAWDGERNGEYEPYVSHTYELDDTLELRGIPKLDANNQLYYDGDVYESDGSVTRKYGIVDLGTLTWTMESTGKYFIAPLNPAPAMVPVLNIGNCKCIKYPTISFDNIYNHTVDFDKVISLTNSVNDRVYIRDTTYASATAFQTAMSGVYLVYELATPTTESATPYTNPQIVSDWGTETYTDYSYDAQTRDVQIPVGHETRYMANLKAKLEMAPESPNGDGDYIVRQTSGENAYVAIGSSPTIQHKAEIDGTYDDMNVGGAKQLLSNVFEEDQVPYTFRTSGGSIDIGDREYDTVVGGTIAWNQLIQSNFANGSNQSVTFSVSNDELTVTSANSSNAVKSRYKQLQTGHVYLMSGYAKSDGTSEVGIGFRGTGGISVTVNSATLWSLPSDYTFISRIGYSDTEIAGGIMLRNNVEVGGYGVFKSITIFDLTQMFGSTVANYIMSLESANLGAGVAWFKKLFPKPYYAYNAGELMSVQASSHDMTGFNQWDEEWEVGAYSVNTGEKVSSSANIRNKNIIRVLPNTTYYAQFPSGSSMNGILFYDAGKNYLGSSYAIGKANAGTFTTPIGACYINFQMSSYGTTYKNDICINLRWDGERDGEYEPYEKRTYPLDDSLTLRGIPKLDASNNLYYDGDTYESDGTVTRKYGIVDLGTLTWTYNSDNAFFYANLPSDAVAPVAGGFGYDGVCGKYQVATGMNSVQFYSSDKTLIYSNNSMSSSKRVFVRDTSYTDAATFKTAMSGVYLVYELATPTTETAEPFQSPQIVDDWGTEEYVTTSIVPVGHNTKYTANLRAKIEMAPDSPSGDGDYIVRQADGTNSYVPLVIPNELPTMPTTDGTYRLQVVVASGTPTLSWVSAT